MRGMDAAGRFEWFRSAAMAAALVVAGGWLGAAVDPAGAAFPGRNGKIAFASNRTTGAGVDNPTGDLEIFTMNPDGTGLKQLTKNTADDGDPAWSPDGKKIAFTSTRDGNTFDNGEVYTMNANGANQTRRTNIGADDGQADWQPRRRR